MKTPRPCILTDSQLVAYKNRPFSFLYHYVKCYKGPYIAIISSVLVAVGCAVSASYVLRGLVDVLRKISLEAQPSFWPAWSILAGLVGLIAADNLMWRVGGWLSSYVFVRVTGDIRKDLYRYLLGQDSSYFAANMSGALVGRISAIANAVFTLENLLTWNVLPPCLNILFSIVLMLTVSPLLGGCVIIVAILLCLLLLHMALQGRPLHTAFAQCASRVEGEMIDAIGNIGLVRSFGQNEYEVRRLHSVMRHEMQARTRSLRYMEKLRFVHAIMTAILTAGLLVWVVMLWQWGQATIGDVVMVVGLGFMILHGTRDLAVALVEATQHQARLKEGLNILLAPHHIYASHSFSGKPDIKAQPDVEKKNVSASIEYRNIDFFYPERKTPVLKHFNLHIEPGTKVGFVGLSGAGKSTLVALLQRFYVPQNGMVLINGEDIASMSEKKLRHYIAIVPQEVALFQRSIRDNIKYGCPRATDEEVIEAARAAECLEFIENLPDGFDTQVGNRGVRLSGGQKQRLAIARAFLKNAPIIILDEATSALDTTTEKKIQHVLHRLMADKTVVAIAHRLSTLQAFDRIVVLEQGKIVQDGPPHIIENEEGPFRALRLQQGL